MRLAMIEWEDSAGYSGWHQLDPWLDSISKCVTIGLLCKEDERQVVIALSKSNSGNFGDTISIPKSCIKRIRYLKVK